MSIRLDKLHLRPLAKPFLEFPVRINLADTVWAGLKLSYWWVPVSVGQLFIIGGNESLKMWSI